MAPLEDGFGTALANFKARLTAKEEDDFQFTTLEDVRQEIARIQTDQGSRKAMMNMPRIQSFLEAMDQFGKVIGVFSNTSPFVAFIWGPVKFVLQVASTWADSFETILDAYEKIGSEIPLLQQFRDRFNYSPRVQRVLEMVYTDILEFHKRAIRFFSVPVWRQVFRSAWKDFKTRFQHILDSLRNHRQLLESQANLIHFQQYQRDRIDTFAKLDRLEAAERQKKYISVMEWVSGAQTKLDHDSACDARREYPESGSWILKHPKLVNWKDAGTPTSSIFWLHGIPGAGKTILASVVIENCREHKSFTTSFFYCKYGDPEKNNFISILKGLLSQLIFQCRDLIPYCHDNYLASGELVLTSAGRVKQLLEVLFQRLPKQYIILDGLDECDPSERKLLLSFFNSTVERYDEKDPGRIRVLFISQDEKDIRKALENPLVLKIQPTNNKDDIRAFVHSSTMKIQRKYQLDSNEINRVIDWICARAKDMFLFAKLVMSNLSAQPTLRQFWEEIDPNRFPEGLEQAYERIMSRIKQNSSPEEWKIARKLLGWMVCAKRPLKWHEIQGAVSIDPVAQTVNFDALKLRVHIQDLCGSLIQVLPGDRVELVHSTAKYYIPAKDYVRTSIVECNLTALCLQYLTFDCFDDGICQDRLIHLAMTGYFAFQDYAVANWSRHFCAMVEAGQDLLGAGLDGADAIEELSDAITDFVDNYEKDLSPEAVLSHTQEACAWFKQFNFHPHLLSVLDHVYRHREKGFSASNDVSLIALSSALARNRGLLEELTSSAYQSLDEQEDMNAFYGMKRYKCPKLTCFYFYEGFEDIKQRKIHINRHDRPFGCTFPECSAAEFGCILLKDLEKHMKSYHPESSDLATTFAAPKTLSASMPFACHMCDKRFTRNFHLKSHIRNHNGERPYACSQCGKAFTRENDCKRHEKIHTRR